MKSIGACPRGGSASPYCPPFGGGGTDSGTRRQQEFRAHRSPAEDGLESAM